MLACIVGTQSTHLGPAGDKAWNSSRSECSHDNWEYLPNEVELSVLENVDAGYISFGTERR